MHACIHHMLLTIALVSALLCLTQDWDSAFGLGSALMRDAEALQLPLPSAGATPSAAAQALRTQAARLRELEEQAAELRHSGDSAAAGARAALVSVTSVAATLLSKSSKTCAVFAKILNFWLLVTRHHVKIVQVSKFYSVNRCC
jgi:hypothetical protein